MFEEAIDNLKRRKNLMKVLELMAVTFGLLPYAVAINQLLVPHVIVPGGATGVSEIVYFATNGFMPIWLTNLLINVGLLCVAIPALGWKFCFRTVWGVFSLSMWYKLVPIATEPILHDPFMSCVVAGLLCGAGIGVVMLNGGSSGGTDIVAMLLNKYKHITLGKTLFACDLVIMSSAYFLPDIQSIEPIMMGLCFTFMMTQAVDTVISHAHQSTQFFIFSMYKSKEIAAAINKEANRGCTILNGQGGFSKKPIEVVVVLAKEHETNHIFRIIKEIDPNAFVSQTNAKGVYGKGFDTVLNKKEQERARQLEIEFEQEAKRKEHDANEDGLG